MQFQRKAGFLPENLVPSSKKKPCFITPTVIIFQKILQCFQNLPNFNRKFHQFDQLERWINIKWKTLPSAFL